MSNNNNPENKENLLCSHAIKALMTSSIANITSIYLLAKEYNMLNSQEFMDWQDELNKISVKYE
jgi:hypothetical protein